MITAWVKLSFLAAFIREFLSGPGYRAGERPHTRVRSLAAMPGREWRADENGASVAQNREPDRAEACEAERDARGARSAGEQQGLARRMGAEVVAVRTRQSQGARVAQSEYEHCTHHLITVSSSDGH